MKKPDKAKKGRPVKYDDKFYKLICMEHETLSISELAKYHNASNSTVIRWLARGRELMTNNDTQQKP